MQTTSASPVHHPARAIRRILVPTDFSEASERAVTMALEIAEATGAELKLLHVWSVPYMSCSEGLAWPLDAMESGAKKALSELADRVVLTHPATTVLLRQGVAWREILDVVHASGIDLVVMGTHGRKGLPRLFLGSVAEKVVRQCSAPVLTVGHADTPS